ncbi:MAG: hypothetical protein U0996_06370 [Planctomycetaceae bacterium]
MNRMALRATRSALLSCFFGFGAAEIAAAGIPQADQFPGDTSVSTDLWKKEFFERKPEDNEENITADALRNRSVLQNENDLLVGTAPRIQLAKGNGLQVASSELPTLSDWEHAATKAIGPKEINITTLEGPSAVTLVVAVVGLIVVGGAYLQK